MQAYSIRNAMSISSTLKPPQSRPPVGNADTIVNSLGKFPNKGSRDMVLSVASGGQFTYNEPSCGGIGGGPSIGSQLEQVGIVSGLKVGLGAVPVVGGLLSGIASLATLPFAHHQQAVKREQATLCAAVPQANNFLLAIDAAVAQGQIDVPTAIQTMEQAYQDWRTQVKAVLQDTGGKCNAACVYEKAFRAGIEYRKQKYALIQSQNNSGAQGLLHGVVDAFSGAVNSVTGAVAGAVSSPSTLQQAGLTPARQSSLAGVVLVGGLIFSGLLFFKFSNGGKK